MENMNLKFEINEIYDFMGSLLRVGFYDNYDNAVVAMHSFHPDEHLKSWADETRKGFNKEMLQDFEFFFDSETVFATGTLFLALDKNVTDVGGFIRIIEETPGNILTLYLIQSGESPLNIQGLEELKKQSQGIYRHVEENFNCSSENKWRILSLIDDPDRYKDRLINFMRNFYEEYYKPVRDRSMASVSTQSTQIIEYINGDQGTRVKELTLINPGKDTPSRIVIGFSYYPEFGISIMDNPDKNITIVLMGTKRMELLRLMNMDSLSEEDLIDIFKVIGDKLRLEILKMLKEGPVYGTQVAERLNMSNPAVSYHMDQFASSGLVKAEKEGHRMYFYLKPERIEQVIKYLREFVRKEE